MWGLGRGAGGGARGITLHRSHGDGRECTRVDTSTTHDIKKVPALKSLYIDAYDAGCPGSSPANQRALPGTDAATSAQCRWSPALLLQVHVAPCPTACGQPVRSRGEEPLALAQGCMPSSEVMTTSRLK